jgi:predicted GIY-YIG superfamily endonuclease
MTCVYILQSQKAPKRFYTGITGDLRERSKKLAKRQL